MGQVCENLADGTHDEAQKEVQSTVNPYISYFTVIFFFSPCYLLLLLIIVFRYNTLTVQQYTFTLFQSSLLSSSLVPGNWSLYDCHHNHYHDKYKFPGNFFMAIIRCDKGGRKGILILCMVGR